MSKAYGPLTQDLSRTLNTLRQDMPEVMQGFSQLAQAATAEGALDLKTKELIALAIGIACRCDGCIGFHAKKLAQLKASRQEILEVLGMATYMGGGPSLMYAADALNAFEEFSDQKKPAVA